MRKNAEAEIQQKNDTMVVADSVIMIDSALREAPLLVIENCGALWREHCIADSSADWSAVLRDAKIFFSDCTLVSVGTNGITNQELVSVYCMEGECGEDQVALKLKNNECFGILLPKYSLGKNPSFSEMKRKPADSISSLIKIQPEKNILDSKLYSAKNDEIVVYLTGQGHIQENEWPHFDKIKWRLAKKENGKWTWYEWQWFDLTSVRLPLPVGIIESGPSFKIVWYHGESICCPSESKAWITDVVFDPKGALSATNGNMYPGGFGQPCD